MNKGLVDIGAFMEPVSTEDLDYIRIRESDHWVISMKPDDPLANWLGADFNKIKIVFTSNFSTNAEITANTVIAWRRNIPHSYAVHKFIEEINAFKA